MTIEFHPHPADIAPINPNTCQEIAAALAKWLALAGLLALIVGFAWGGLTAARASSDDQDDNARHTQGNNAHPNDHQPIHERFYADWMRLDTGTSCCNKQDCFPTMMRQAADGTWYALRQRAARELELQVLNGLNPVVPPLTDLTAWIVIPERFLEHNAERVDLGVKSPRTERDSPDGRSHACVNGDTVYCAVVGGGG